MAPQIKKLQRIDKIWWRWPCRGAQWLSKKYRIRANSSRKILIWFSIRSRMQIICKLSKPLSSERRVKSLNKEATRSNHMPFYRREKLSQNGKEKEMLTMTLWVLDSNRIFKSWFISDKRAPRHRWKRNSHFSQNQRLSLNRTRMLLSLSKNLSRTQKTIKNNLS